MSIDSITLWHKRARPQPTYEQFNVQLGCHFEEIAEMLNALVGDDTKAQNRISTVAYQVSSLAEALKSGTITAYPDPRVEFIDAIADQVVTAIGTAYCAGMDVVKALDIVNTSNWSKYDENGNPLFNEQGKIMKGPRYTPPHLDECTELPRKEKKDV